MSAKTEELESTKSFLTDPDLKKKKRKRTKPVEK